EAIVHTFLAIIKARRLKADVLHIHAIGPSLLTPFARLLGMKVVMTNHGPDYDRQKWSYPAKAMLKLGERLGTLFSNNVIVISRVIADILASRYGRTDTRLIYNGVSLPTKSDKTDYIESLGLQPKKYIVAVGRFVKEKGFHDLIEAYGYLRDRYPGYRLAIAGDADHPDQYSNELKDQARKSDVVLTGFIRGEKMNQLMTNAALFVIPSYHEGLPFSLLEAMSYNLDVIASDIPANELQCLDSDDYFKTGDIKNLSHKISARLDRGYRSRTYDLSAYDWNHIARQTENTYALTIK
ncbi:MAG: glycosyltransferase family 4 protein, partial [Paramuribaculum sp.]|nr:glycosyltransferase family 4 protein [Paramuribaculum sp.]